jgi:hypothetical protein
MFKLIQLEKTAVYQKYEFMKSTLISERHYLENLFVLRKCM